MTKDTEKLEVMLATDCGSTTTKAILVVKTEEGYRLAGRGEAPTTVEAPFDDVTVGVKNAVEELEDIMEVISSCRSSAESKERGTCVITPSRSMKIRSGPLTMISEMDLSSIKG